VTDPLADVKEPLTEDGTEVEIDLGEIDWSALPEAEAPPACDAAPALSAAPAPPAPVSPAPEPAATTTPEAEVRDEPEQPARSFHPAFAEIASRIEHAPLRALVGSTFARLLRVLDTLGVIEKALSRPQAVKVGRPFEDVRAQSASLLAHVTAAVSGDAGLDPRVRETLDGVRFVVGHELAKVFRQEFPGINGDRPEYSRADLSRAWGLLHNCLQQTAISLAQSFAPGITGEQLFEDYRCKVENSFTLYGELQGLLHRVRAAENSNGILLKHALVRHLEHFRDETMHFLMYKDWAEFGRYVDKVKRAFEEMEDFDAVLHEFSQYLGTLIHHVGMREVLRSGSPQSFEDAGAAGRGF
jgi:hypothetical protein